MPNTPTYRWSDKSIIPLPTRGSSYGGVPPLDMQEHLARDLYQLHKETGISLDHWVTAKDFVEWFYGIGSVEPNGA